MKKYLIRGTLALVLGGLLASCQKDEDLQGSLVADKIVTFEKVFKEEFGEIDPNHTWGFGTTSKVSAARAVTRAHNKNSNMWASQGWIIPDPLTDEQKDKVRRYFQQNKQPQGVSLNFTNFFVQQVYEGHSNTTGSKSAEIYLSGADAANDKAPSVIPGNQMDLLTAGSAHDHINDFNSGTRDEINVQNNNMDGEHNDAITLMVNSSTDCFGYYNSHESHHYDDQFIIIPGDDIQAWDSTGGAVADVSGMYFVGFDFDMTYSAWRSYIDWQGNPVTELNTNTNEYLVTPDEENGYVLPNDHTGGKKFRVGAADGYYSDWIVRITEGLKRSSDDPEEIQIPIDKPSSETGKIPVYEKVTVYDKLELTEEGRVFCEDLGSMDKSDFDYNDVVFDAYIYKKLQHTVKTYVTDKGEVLEERTVEETAEEPIGYTAQIVLLAAGGTLELSVADVKVKDRFGAGIGTLVNTAKSEDGAWNNPFTSHAPVILDPIEGIKSIQDIKIAVKYSHQALLLQAEQGKAAHKFLVPIGTEWAIERGEFAKAYKSFGAYVGWEGTKFWEGDKDSSLIFGDLTYERPEAQKLVKKSETTSEEPVDYIDGDTTTSGGYNGEEVLIRVRN